MTTEIIHPLEAFLLTNDIDDLAKEPYNMTVRKQEVDGGLLALVDYDQIKSPRHNKLCDSCRGVIIDVETKQIVCLPFDRFYNFGENQTTDDAFDFSSAVAYSKEDGSLIKVYHYRGKWRIATRGTIIADNTVFDLAGNETSDQITFSDLFLRTLGLSYDDFNEIMNANYDPGMTTHLFELCTSTNRVVTPYESDRVYYLGSRLIAPCKPNHTREISYDPFDQYGLLDDVLYRPEEFPVSSFSEVLEAVSKLKNLKEGFVIKDAKGTRLKVKSAAYVVAHHCRGSGLTPKRAVDLVLANEYHEFISYFPEYADYIMKYVIKENVLRINAFAFMMMYGKITDKKEFALLAKDTEISGILFSMHNHGLTYEQAFDRLTINSKYKLFGVKE